MPAVGVSNPRPCLPVELPCKNSTSALREFPEWSLHETSRPKELPVRGYWIWKYLNSAEPMEVCPCTRIPIFLQPSCSSVAQSSVAGRTCVRTKERRLCFGHHNFNEMMDDGVAIKNFFCDQPIFLVTDCCSLSTPCIPSSSGWFWTSMLSASPRHVHLHL